IYESVKYPIGHIETKRGYAGVAYPLYVVGYSLLKNDLFFRFRAVAVVYFKTLYPVIGLFAIVDIGIEVELLVGDSYAPAVLVGRTVVAAETIVSAVAAEYVGPCAAVLPRLTLDGEILAL
ncbi:MAG: hypothetical protein K2K77_07560, partial [Duncaniella sp.]|nr:hypothetical protein [Duncaniella sp.]